MATNYPRTVRAVIAHEPPVTRLLPEARKLQRIFAGAYKSVFNFGRFGITLALLGFAFGTGLFTAGIINRKMLAAYKLAKVHRETTAEPRLKSDDVFRFFFKQELLIDASRTFSRLLSISTSSIPFSFISSSLFPTTLMHYGVGNFIQRRYRPNKYLN